MTYTSTRHGYYCAAMMRYRPENADSKRIEIYPTSQWGDIGVDYEGPENERRCYAREAVRAFLEQTIEGESDVGRGESGAQSSDMLAFVATAGKAKSQR